ncbi:hypothetical protein EE612_050491 [Oryza sativa]|nr:hypothetical protein EE612_050491 [Oryza sativa]
MDIVGAGTSPAPGWKAPASMVLVQLFNSGMILLSKVSINGGMFVFAALVPQRIRCHLHPSLCTHLRARQVEGH